MRRSDRWQVCTTAALVTMLGCGRVRFDARGDGTPSPDSANGTKDGSAPASSIVLVADNANNRIQRFDLTGTYLGQLGCASGACVAGAGDGQFVGPNRAAIDDAGNIWVADSGNNRIQEFDSSGAFLMSFGSAGTGVGQFNIPNDLAIDRNGDLWVADYNNHRLQKFDHTGTFLDQFGSLGNSDGQFSCGVNAVAIDGLGELWVTVDCNGHPVQKFTATGTWLQTIYGAAPLQTPSQLAFDAAGDLWVTDWEGSSTGLYLEKLNASGTYLGALGAGGAGDGQFMNPQGIAIDSDGNLWIADWTNNDVQVFTSTGAFVRRFGGTGSGNGQFRNASYITIR